MEHTLELEFSVEQEKRYIKQNPERALELAIAYFEDFSVLVAEFKQLERDYKALQVENTRIKSSKTHKSVRPPSFVNSRGKAL